MARAGRVLFHILEDGVKGLGRAPALALASAATVTMALMLLGVFVVAAANGAWLGRTLAAQTQMQVFFQPGLSAAAEARVARALRAMPGVRRVVFLSRVQAMAALRRQFAGDAQVEAVLAKNNPLLDSDRVYVTGPAAGFRVSAAASRLAGVAKVVYPGQEAAALGRLLAVGRTVFGVLLGVFLVSGFLLVSGAVRLSVLARRREMEIMLLVGASHGMVRGPFVVEGALLGLVGGAVASGALLAGYQAMASLLTRAVPFLPVLPAAVLAGELVRALLLGGLALGVAGAVFALRPWTLGSA